MPGPPRRSGPAGSGPAATRPASAGRSGAGPAGRRRTAGGAAPAVAAASRRAGLTGRAAVLALVLCALALTLAYPLRSYLAQRAEIGALEDRVVAQQERVTELTAERRRWDDPAFVKAQARERLFYVLPGETQYLVLEPEEAPAPPGQADARPAPDRPWYDLPWQSIEDARR